MGGEVLEGGVCYLGGFCLFVVFVVVFKTTNITKHIYDYGYTRTFSKAF